MSSSMASSSPARDIRATRRPLRRLTLELFAIVALKIAVLMLIWWVAFAPHPKPDTSADAIAQKLAPSPQTPPAGTP